MNKKYKFYISVLLVFITLFTLSGCFKTAYSVKTGVYVTADEMSYLRIDISDKTFEFQRGVTSYIPSGIYDINGNKLLLYIYDENYKTDFEFLITEDHLIFESGKLAEDIIEKGTKFIYKSED